MVVEVVVGCVCACFECVFAHVLFVCWGGGAALRPPLGKGPWHGRGRQCPVWRPRGLVPGARACGLSAFSSRPKKLTMGLPSSLPSLEDTKMALPCSKGGRGAWGECLVGTRLRRAR